MAAVCAALERYYPITGHLPRSTPSRVGALVQHVLPKPRDVRLSVDSVCVCVCVWWCRQWADELPPGKSTSAGAGFHQQRRILIDRSVHGMGDLTREPLSLSFSLLVVGATTCGGGGGGGVI